MKRLVSMMVLVGIITTGCSSKENPKTILEKNGEKIVILQDRQNPSLTPNLGKYENELNYIIEIGPGILGKFLDEKRFLVIKRNKNDLNNLLIYDLGKGEEILLVSDIEGDVFRLSPEKKKLLFMKNDMGVVVLNLEEKSLAHKTTEIHLYENITQAPIKWLKENNEVIKESLSWADEERILYSDRRGIVYITNIENQNTSHYETDSPYKANIYYSQDKLIYLKDMTSWVQDMYEDSREIYKTSSYTNTIAFTSLAKNSQNKNIPHSHPVQTILRGSAEENITSFRISPDEKKVAVYYQGEGNKGNLLVISMKDLFQSTKEPNLIHISNERIIDFVWSNDSEKLAYSIEGQEPGLYVVNHDGSDKGILLINKNISNLQWNEEGDSLIGTEENNEEYRIVLIKLKEKEQEN